MWPQLKDTGGGQAMRPAFWNGPGAMEPDEDYQSPFDFAAGVNKEYLYLSPRGHLSPPGSPVPPRLGNHECPEFTCL